MYDTRRVMEECLAIKPDLVFLWDEAWFGFARFNWMYRPRTAMGARQKLRESFADPRSLDAYLEQEQKFGGDLDPSDARLLDVRLVPDPRRREDPRLPDELDAQVDVGAAPGLDGAGGRRGVPSPRATVP